MSLIALVNRDSTNIHSKRAIGNLTSQQPYDDIKGSESAHETISSEVVAIDQ